VSVRPLKIFLWGPNVHFTVFQWDRLKFLRSPQLDDRPRRAQRAFSRTKIFRDTYPPRKRFKITPLRPRFGINTMYLVYNNGHDETLCLKYIVL